MLLTVDIDECITGLDNCPETSNCKNLVGNFSCGVIPIIESQAVGMIIRLQNPCAVLYNVN